MKNRRDWLYGLGACGAGLALPGCGVVSTVASTLSAPATPPPLAVPTALFDVVADPSLNLDHEGVPKPLLLRIYELRASASFDRASFFDLQDKDETQLGSDFVRREEFLFTPGQRQTIERKGNPDVRAFGLFAAYRDLERSTWRASIAAPNSVELRRRWFGLGPTESLKPVHYTVTLTRDAVRVHLTPVATK